MNFLVARNLDPRKAVGGPIQAPFNCLDANGRAVPDPRDASDPKSNYFS